MTWAYEGNEGYLSLKAKTHHKAIYRAWNDAAGNHFYTTSKAEYDALKMPYSKEGRIGYVSKKNDSEHKSLYGLRHPGTGDHILTTTRKEITRRKQEGYVSQGTLGYVGRSRHDGHQPLYRAYDPERDDHLYTADVDEIDDYGPTLTLDEMDRLLRKQLKGYTNYCRIYLADDDYYCPSEEVARDIALDAGIDELDYRSEVFDCDDFAHVLKAAFIQNVYDSGSRSMPYAVGVVWGEDPPHAMNVVVVSDGRDYEVKIVEPQDAEFFDPADAGLGKIYLIVA